MALEGDLRASNLFKGDHCQKGIDGTGNTIHRFRGPAPATVLRNIALFICGWMSYTPHVSWVFQRNNCLTVYISNLILKENSMKSALTPKPAEELYNLLKSTTDPADPRHY